jgi:hypothetical protein
MFILIFTTYFSKFTKIIPNLFSSPPFSTGDTPRILALSRRKLPQIPCQLSTSVKRQKYLKLDFFFFSLLFFLVLFFSPFSLYGNKKPLQNTHINAFSCCSFFKGYDNVDGCTLIHEYGKTTHTFVELLAGDR